MYPAPSSATLVFFPVTFLASILVFVFDDGRAAASQLVQTILQQSHRLGNLGSYARCRPDRALAGLEALLPGAPKDAPGLHRIGTEHPQGKAKAGHGQADR